MADSSATLTEPIPTVNDLSNGQITENVISEEPPSYISIFPESIIYPKPSSSIHQPQSESRYNINSTTTIVNPQLTITQSTSQIECYTMWSIFNIFCCCLCFGCLACYYSYKTGGLKNGGDIQGALYASQKARIMNKIATITGIVLIIIYIISFTM